MDRFRVLVAAIGLIAAATSPSASPELSRFEYQHPHMGTLVRITLYAPSAAAADRAAHAAFERVRALDAALSDYRDSSELMGVSRLSGRGPVAVSADLFRVLDASVHMTRASGGAFDITVGPLSVLWRHARRAGEMPESPDLAAARALVGSDTIVLDRHRRTVTLLKAGMQLDLGGIAKGFAADEAASSLAQRGIARALIAVGGDIVATAPPPGQQGWRVAVAAIEGAPPAGFIDLRNAAVSTSGDAEQFVVISGRRFSHIIDPRTGTALTGRRSVTIVARNGTNSDALATAVSVMGARDGLALVESTPGAAARVSEETGGGIRSYQSSRWPAPR